MSEELVIVPSSGDGFVELARTRSGRLFRKHILNKGDLRHPVTGKTIKIDDTFVKTLKKNFDSGVCDIVQVPLANEKNEHSEAPDRNIGEVVGIEESGDKVFAVLDVRKAEYAEELGKTLLGASAMMHLDYTDTKTGQKVGPTLLHTCVTNRPYVTGLENYEEIVAASDSSDEAVVLLTEDNAAVAVAEKPTEEKDMPDEAKPQDTPTKASLEELLTALKTDHGIDVDALKAQATEAASAAALSKTLVDALTEAGVVKLTNTDDKDNVSNEDVVGAVAELAKNNVALTDRVNKLERQDAEHIVDALVGEGRVIPAQRAAFVELKLSNPTMFDQLVPAEPIVKLNNEQGKTPPNDEAHKKDVDADIERYVKLTRELAGVK